MTGYAQEPIIVTVVEREIADVQRALAETRTELASRDSLPHIASALEAQLDGLQNALTHMQQQLSEI